MKELIVDLSKMSISDADGMPLGMLSVTAGDLEPVIIKTTGTLTGYSPVIAIKTSALSADLLALADNLTNNSGVWSGVLNFNTANLRTAMDGLENLDAILELVWKKSTGEQRTCAHISLQIKADIYRGNEGMPADLPTNMTELINQSVNDYLTNNPPTPTGPTQDQVNQAVSTYLSENPPIVTVEVIKPWSTTLRVTGGSTVVSPPEGFEFMVDSPFTVISDDQSVYVASEEYYAGLSGYSGGIDKGMCHGIFTNARGDGKIKIDVPSSGVFTKLSMFIKPK